ncbi:MAG: PadR family transcriptional regulator [Promethearchaeota archaeon]
MKYIKDFNPKALINSEKYRQYVENFESEILRGISKLITLHVIMQKGEEGIYGYKLAQDLKKSMMDTLIIKEGTLYPILRKLKADGLLITKKKEYNGRLRNYYLITQKGINIYNHLLGFLTHLISQLSNILNIEIKVNNKQFLICPNCLNRISIENKNQEFCIVCGLNLNQFKK